MVLGAGSGPFGHKKPKDVKPWDISCPQCGDYANESTFTTEEVEKQNDKFTTARVPVEGWRRTCKICSHSWFDEAE